MRGRSPSSHPAKPSAYSLLQIPPLRYELVETDLHRGAYPTLRNFPFLARLRLRTIIALTPEPPTSDLTQLCAHYHIALHHYKVAYPADSLAVPAAAVTGALGVVLCRSALPAYIHCLDGRSVTGVVVGVLRRLQHWRVESCVAEYERMCGGGSGDVLKELLCEWSEPVQLNSQLLPSWLWDGKWCTQHPTMALLDDSATQRSGVIVEVADTVAIKALTTSDKKKLLRNSSSSSAQPTASDTDTTATTAAANSADDPNAALLARWTARRSYLHYDTLLSSQPITLPDGSLQYSVDRRMAGATAYLEYLMLEGATISNTFPRPLPLLHCTPSTTGVTSSSVVHAGGTESTHS